MLGRCIAKFSTPGLASLTLRQTAANGSCRRNENMHRCNHDVGLKAWRWIGDRRMIAVAIVRLLGYWSIGPKGVLAGSMKRFLPCLKDVQVAWLLVFFAQRIISVFRARSATCVIRTGAGMSLAWTRPSTIARDAPEKSFGQNSHADPDRNIPVQCANRTIRVNTRPSPLILRCIV
jgi:hypothetical protein